MDLFTPGCIWKNPVSYQLESGMAGAIVVHLTPHLACGGGVFYDWDHVLLKGFMVKLRLPPPPSSPPPPPSPSGQSASQPFGFPFRVMMIHACPKKGPFCALTLCC